METSDRADLPVLSSRLPGGPKPTWMYTFAQRFSCKHHSRNYDACHMHMHVYGHVRMHVHSSCLWHAFAGRRIGLHCRGATSTSVCVSLGAYRARHVYPRPRRLGHVEHRLGGRPGGASICTAVRRVLRTVRCVLNEKREVRAPTRVRACVRPVCA